MSRNTKAKHNKEFPDVEVKNYVLFREMVVCPNQECNYEWHRTKDSIGVHLQYPNCNQRFNVIRGRVE